MRLRAGICILLLLVAGGLGSAASAAQPVPRKIIALYHDKEGAERRFGNLHQFLEMPFNHLGYVLDYHEIGELPEIGPDVAGVVSWFEEEVVEDHDAYIQWLDTAQRQGAKILIIGDMGLGTKWREQPGNMEKVNAVLSRIGFVDTDRWVGMTYPAAIQYSDPEMIGFERQLRAPYPPYMIVKASAPDATSHLRILNPDDVDPMPADLVITTPRGGYVAQDYAVDIVSETEERYLHQWLIDPFHLLYQIFGDELPLRPDVTTLNGRRIFYAHMDGDGWNNVAQFPPYKAEQVTASEVLYREIFKPMSELGFTVGIVAGEVDTACYGQPGSAGIATRILTLPNVEAATHSYTHPLSWKFFKDYTPEKEAPYMRYYPTQPGQSTLWNDVKGLASGKLLEKLSIFDAKDPYQIENRYATPRSYACVPFSEENEVQGSVDFVEELTDGKKEVKLFQWTGDTDPYPEFIRKTREAGLLNINGGDSRLDGEFPSYTFVAPIGYQEKGELQVYSSNSNENLYTDLWTQRFYGYRYLRSTIHNTESPIRIDPFNIYFHTYSGEKRASLNALKENLRYAQEQRIIPIFASDYAAIAQDFYKTEIVSLGANRWQIANRGNLNTVRMRKASDIGVEFGRSRGVLGYNYHQGSLYIALDPAEEAPIVAVKEFKQKEIFPGASEPYLVESRWKIRGLQKGKNSLSFSAHGFGQGEMIWKIPAGLGNCCQIEMTYNNKVTQTMQVKPDADGLLRFALPAVASGSNVNVSIEFGPL